MLWCPTNGTLIPSRTRAPSSTFASSVDLFKHSKMGPGPLAWSCEPKRLVPYNPSWRDSVFTPWKWAKTASLGIIFPGEEPADQHTIAGDLNPSATEFQGKHMALGCLQAINGVSQCEQDMLGLVMGVTGAKKNVQRKSGMPLGKIPCYQDVLKVS